MTDVLEAGLQDVDQQLTDGRTLPASWYWDEAIFARERDHIFARMWQYAGPVDWITQPGQYFPCKAGHTPLVVTRGDDGEVRAFVNVCRHRGCAVVKDRGNKGSLQCPYHAWTYGMDGGLRAAPRSERETSFDRAEFGLAPARAEVWGPFVFVNADPEAAPLSETLSDLPAAIAASGLDVSQIGSAIGRSGIHSRSIGRSASRTISSATTARSRIPASIGFSTHAPTPGGSRPIGHTRRRSV